MVTTNRSDIDSFLKYTTSKVGSVTASTSAGVAVSPAPGAVLTRHPYESDILTGYYTVLIDIDCTTVPGGCFTFATANNTTAYVDNQRGSVTVTDNGARILVSALVNADPTQIVVTIDRTATTFGDTIFLYIYF